LEGVSGVDVNVENSEVNFELASQNLLEKVQKQLKKIGYPVVGEANSLTSKAKSFISCASGKMNQ
ncbi:MAG: heavy metal transporter, partial [Flavobacteriaceae bacterium]|nr:heavy metal transporter [Flavobacteriaceae bacterium]